MPIKISAESLSAIKLGASDLAAAYVGETRIFPNDITVSYVTPTGQGLTYTTPANITGSPGSTVSPTVTFTGTAAAPTATPALMNGKSIATTTITPATATKWFTTKGSYGNCCVCCSEHSRHAGAVSR